MRHFLVGSSFPLSLIRRAVQIAPRSTESMVTAMHERPWASFWGHNNTVAAASTILCQDIRPQKERPALTLSPEGLPMFEGRAYDEAWILSAELPKDFRPAPGEEVDADKIKDWQVLQIEWTDA